ncbi:MAG: heparinase II/III family protein, partial [Acidobacteriota bacterium]|nr:heparinase II/III family protein [Acidobacteriota bacterium]
MANRLLFVKARARRKAQREAVGRMNKRESILRFHPSSLIPHPSIARALRGDVSAASVLRETWRRGRVALESRRERARLKRASGVAATDASARLRPEFAALSPTQLLAHFRTRRAPRFPPGLETPAERLSPLWWREFFPGESEQLVARAHHISDAHRWPLLGFGELELGTEINWLRDPSSGACWSLEYHGDVKLWRGDGSDVRVLWELNRLAHLLTLGQAYAQTGDEKFSGEFFRQLAGWRTQNPTGCGPNWACAMEVALRAVNLLAAFQLFLPSTQLDEANLRMLLATFDEHGQHVRRHLEFSHLATSNHYLSDIAGLLWLGLLLPELVDARGWREFARREMLREMDKQILADGADAESSTGYHRFVLELLLYSFTLCRANDVEIEDRYWRKLRRMLEYTRAYLRPDRRAPLVGDTDGGQFLPLRKRAADDHAYVLAIGAAVLQEPHLKLADDPPAELGWLLGAEGLRAYKSLRAASSPPPSSAAFADAGSYLLRDGDLYLHFNACGAGLGGRGSHGHNDKLSVEVSAHGVLFIADPGTFVYTADLRARHLFRSTAAHSTVEVDETEQNTTREAEPFVIGDEARPRVLRWEITAE